MLQGTSLYLEQLDPDAGKHELEKGGDNHDVADCPDGHKDALDDVLGREEQGEGEVVLLAFAVLALERANTSQDFMFISISLSNFVVLCFSGSYLQGLPQCTTATREEYSVGRPLLGFLKCC